MKAWFALFLILAHLVALVPSKALARKGASQSEKRRSEIANETMDLVEEVRHPSSKPTPKPKAKQNSKSSSGKSPSANAKKETGDELTLDDEPSPTPASKPEVSPTPSASAGSTASSSPAPTPAPAASPAAKTLPATLPAKTETKPVTPEAPKVETKVVPSSKTNAHIEKLKAKIAANPRDFDSMVELAQDYINLKNHDAVIALLQPHIDSLPRAGLISLARSYSTKNDFTNELKMLELCLVKHPKDYVVQTMIGDTYALNIRTKDEALKAYQTAREMNGRYRPAFEGQVKLLERDGQFYEARNVLADMLKLFGEEGKLVSTMCRLYALDNYFEKAVETCEQAIKKSPSLADNYVYLSSALKGEEQVDRSFKVLADASTRFPASEMVQVAHADAWAQKKDYTSAYKYYKKASQATPKTARAFLGYANSSFELQKYQEALDAYVQTCKIDKRETKDFRVAAGKLRERKDLTWQMRYESSLSRCN